MSNSKGSTAGRIRRRDGEIVLLMLGQRRPPHRWKAGDPQPTGPRRGSAEAHDEPHDRQSSGGE